MNRQKKNAHDRRILRMVHEQTMFDGLMFCLDKRERVSFKRLRSRGLVTLHIHPLLGLAAKARRGDSR